MVFTNNAFPLLFEKLKASPEKNAVTGLPRAGRNMKKYNHLATQYSLFFGNLYGVTDDFLKRLTSKKIHLPVGLCWIDSQLTKLINDNLEFSENDYRHRVTFIEEVGYEFESLKLFNPSDIYLSVDRICRYKTGQLQEPYLDQLPFIEWPATMEAINANILKNGVTLADLGKLFPFRYKIIKRLNKKFTGEPGVDA